MSYRKILKQVGYAVEESPTGGWRWTLPTDEGLWVETEDGAWANALKFCSKYAEGELADMLAAEFMGIEWMVDYTPSEDPGQATPIFIKLIQEFGGFTVMEVVHPPNVCGGYEMLQQDHFAGASAPTLPLVIVRMAIRKIPDLNPALTLEEEVERLAQLVADSDVPSPLWDFNDKIFDEIVEPELLSRPVLKDRLDDYTGWEFYSGLRKRLAGRAQYLRRSNEGKEDDTVSV